MNRIRKEVPLEPFARSKWRREQIAAVRARRHLFRSARHAVYPVLIGYVNVNPNNLRYGLAWPGYGRVAGDTGLDEATVKRAFRALEEEGVILVAFQAGPHRTNLVAFPQIVPTHDGIEQGRLPSSAAQSAPSNSARRPRIIKDYKKPILDGQAIRAAREKAYREMESAFGPENVDGSLSDQLHQLVDEYRCGRITSEAFVSRFKDTQWHLAALTAATRLPRLKKANKQSGRPAAHRGGGNKKSEINRGEHRSGAPFGSRNGRYTQGDWTSEALEVRRWLRSMTALAKPEGTS